MSTVLKRMGGLLKKSSLAVALAVMLMVSAVPLGAAHHDGSDHPIDEDPCACDVELRITSPNGPVPDPNDPDREVYASGTVVELIVPEDCNCEIVELHHEVEWVGGPTQGGTVNRYELDDDTWMFMAPNFNTYFVTFTVWVFCEAESHCDNCEGYYQPVRISWYQFN